VHLGENGVLTVPHQEKHPFVEGTNFRQRKNKYLAKNNIVAYKTKLTTVLTGIQ
jgi:hypothetical protein